MQGLKRIRWFVFVAVIVLPCLGLSFAQGHGGPSEFPEQVLREPKGLPFIVVERQTLTVDLRPLAIWQNPVVETVYQLRKDGEAQRAELVFTTDGLRAPIGSVTFDGKLVPQTWSRTIPNLPAGWAAPRTVPDPAGDGTGVLPYSSPRGFTATCYAIHVPSGPHVLRVKFEAKATVYDGRVPTRAWRLVYGLSPGKHWGGRGEAEVVIKVPPGWLASSTPALQRVSDELQGELDFAADNLAVSTQAPWAWPAGQESLLTRAWVGTALVGLVLCPTCGALVGWLLRRKGRTRSWAWLPSSGVALVVTLTLATLVRLVYYHQGTPMGQGTKHSMDFTGFLILATLHLFTLAAFPVYLLLMQLGALLTYRLRRLPEGIEMESGVEFRPNRAEQSATVDGPYE